MTLPKRSSVPVFKTSTRRTELILGLEGESIALSSCAKARFAGVGRCKKGSPAFGSRSIWDELSEGDPDAEFDFDEIKSERNRRS